MNQSPTPDEIISAFDQILDYVFGRSRGRDYPSKDDHKIAQQWIDQGLTVPIASAVFFQRMSVMHERWLRQRNHNDKTNIPRNIGVFDENILSAINRVKAGGEPIPTWQQAESQWRARIVAWKKDPKFWERYTDHWGMPPNHPACRASLSLLMELVPEHWKKDSLNNIIFL